MKEISEKAESPASHNMPVEFQSTQALETIQICLQQRYDVSVPYSVNQFVCHNASHLQTLCSSNTTSPEMLFYRQDGDNLDLSLYIELNLLEKIEAADMRRDWSGTLFNDCCILLEGVSHFLYLTWNAHYDRQVSLLDMELQAEVDKFVFAALETSAQVNGDLLERLYQQITYRDDLTSDLKRRYETANEYAHMYCTWLTENFSLQHPDRTLAAELARFYRLNGSAKKQHIKNLLH